jgi:hypothetical protein
MNRINEDKLEAHKIHFSSQINERYLKSFAYKVEEILKAMTTGKHAPVSVSGEADKIKAFAKVLGREEKYINALAESGGGTPEAMGVRHELEAAIAEFEKLTGIKWPVR